MWREFRPWDRNNQSQRNRIVSLFLSANFTPRLWHYLFVQREEFRTVIKELMSGSEDSELKLVRKTSDVRLFWLVLFLTIPCTELGRGFDRDTWTVQIPSRSSCITSIQSGELQSIFLSVSVDRFSIGVRSSAKSVAPIRKCKSFFRFSLAELVCSGEMQAGIGANKTSLE